ncbi:MAG TPA: hypothetical protein ENJ08_13550 [Gammaproteobacteria bacterium]|nr:hypothetical protein [Gammaproteobacteria bacterium]
MEITLPATIAMPPTRGIACVWTLRASGISIAPILSAHFITGGIRIIVMTSEMIKAKINSIA